MSNKRIIFDSPGHAHELTFSCYKRENFLNDEKACHYLADAINLAREKHHIKIWAYVFMPNHVHLIFFPEKEIYSNSSILLTIKQSVARRVMIGARKHNPALLAQFATGQISKKYRFWQDGGGYDRNIINRHVVIKMVDYIHNNPVRKGLVDSPGKWKWSSYHDWQHDMVGPIIIDKVSFPVL